MQILLFDDWMTSTQEQLVTEIHSTNEDELYHQHNFYEIFYIIEGSITHIYNGLSEKLNIGDMVLLRKSDAHSFKRKDNEDCAHRDIIISEEQFRKCCDFIDRNLYSTIITSKHPLRAKINNSKICEFENFITEMILVPTDKGVMPRSALINILTVNLINTFMQEIYPINREYPLWIKLLLQRFTVIDYLKEGLPKILEETNYDNSYVCRTFKKYIGCSMTNYLLDIRLEYAATLLQTTSKTIQTISEMIGFDSVQYFAASFKKKFTMTPGQFRKKHKKVFTV